MTRFGELAKKAIAKKHGAGEDLLKVGQLVNVYINKKDNILLATGEVKSVSSDKVKISFHANSSPMTLEVQRNKVKWQSEEEESYWFVDMREK